MKKYTLIVLFQLSMFSVAAQEAPGKGDRAVDLSGFYIKPIYSAGSNWDLKISGEVSGKTEVPQDMDFNGLSIGYEFNLNNPKWSLLTEFQWNNGDVSFGSFNELNVSISDFIYEVDQFTFHIKPAYNINEKLQLMAGPFIGLYNSTTTLKTVTIGGTNYGDISQDIDHTVYGVSVGARYKFTPNLSAEVGYNYFETSDERIPLTQTDWEFEGDYWSFGLMYQF